MFSVSFQGYLDTKQMAGTFQLLDPESELRQTAEKRAGAGLTRQDGATIDVGGGGSA